MNQNGGFALNQGGGMGVQMSLTYRDQLFMAPLARRAKPQLPDRQDFGGHGIGRSPRFAPGWWLTGVAAFYIAVALLCIFLL
jgi:hypothetical protein